MTGQARSLEEYRDEDALACERYALCLERIDKGGVGDLDTHQVTFGDHIMLGQMMTTVGVGLKDASVPRRHALGEVTLTEEQQMRAAILYCTASLITELYDSQTARVILRNWTI